MGRLISYTLTDESEMSDRYTVISVFFPCSKGKTLFNSFPQPVMCFEQIFKINFPILKFSYAL